MKSILAEGGWSFLSLNNGNRPARPKQQTSTDVYFLPAELSHITKAFLAP